MKTVTKKEYKKNEGLGKEKIKRLLLWRVLKWDLRVVKRNKKDCINLATSFSVFFTKCVGVGDSFI